MHDMQPVTSTRWAIIREMAEDAIDLGRLEKELVYAIEADTKYSRENDAKFRAVHQKVATYEEFRDIVKASHLSPLDRHDIVGASLKKPWNPVAHRMGEGGGEGEVEGESLRTSGQPQNIQEFTREWRKLKQSPEQQYQLLIGMSAEKLFEIFKVEIGMGVLGEVLATLNQCWRGEDGHRIHSILACLPETSRFNLAVGFLTRREKEETSELLAKLSRVDLPREHNSSWPSVVQLAHLYAVEAPT